MATSVDMTQRAFAVAFDNLAILRALLQKAEWRMQFATWIIVKYSLSRATMQEKAVAAATATLHVYRFNVVGGSPLDIRLRAALPLF